MFFYFPLIKRWFSAFAFRLPELKALPAFSELKIFKTLNSSFVNGAPLAIISEACAFIFSIVVIFTFNFPARFIASPFVVTKVTTLRTLATPSGNYFFCLIFISFQSVEIQ